jgi:hypothetical protein
MFDDLVAHGRTRLEAATELQRAFEDKAIPIVFNGAELSDQTHFNIGEMLRAFAVDPHEAKIRFLWATDIFKHGRAPRFRFEIACRPPVTPPLDARLTAEDACGALILRLKEGPQMPKADVYARAKAEIPDLNEKEFERAWRSTAGDWKIVGRPKKPLH